MLHYLDQALQSAPSQSAPKLVFSKLSRRNFLAGSGACFAIAAFADGASAFAPYETGGTTMPHGLKTDPHVFVSINAEGIVTIISHRAEMGQGSRTSVPMVLADELGADWDRVRIVQAEGDEPKYGNQDTDGSRSLRHHIQPMRQMGAAVRQMLAQAAAEKWGIDVAAVKVGVHEVTSGSLRAGFGELAELAMAQPVPSLEELTFKSEAEFRYIGKGNVPIYDLHDITVGKAVYGADVSLPGMKIAVIARPPVVGAAPLRFDAAAALAVAGVERIEELPSSIMPAAYAPLGGVAVIASNTDAAIKGRDALNVSWGDSPHGGYNSDAYLDEMRETARESGRVLRQEGDYAGAFRAAPKTFGREYTQSHVAHAPMEPPVAIADVSADRAEIWAPVQSPYGARTLVAQTLGLEIENVRVNQTLLGGGFGRKSCSDFSLEAALLSQKIGAPVRVQWTREDDIQHSFYATTSVERLEVAVNNDNRVVGWRHNSVAPSILSLFAPDSGYQFNIENGQGHVDVPFDVPNMSIENGKAMAHTRIAWYRAVSNVPRAWAIQSFVSDLAAELDRDHLELLLELIGPDRRLDPVKQGFPEDFWNYGEVYEEFPIDTARLKGVLRLAADKAGWGQPLPEGEGIGLAVHRSFMTYVAAAVRVKIVDGRITIPEVHMGVDCGFVANPDRVRSQMEGSCVMGMTTALHSGITYENGAATQSNFHDYPMVRADNFPEIVHTHLVEHPFSVHASGVGEPGLPPVPPAIANAIFQATGKRLAHMPFGDQMEM